MKKTKKGLKRMFFSTVLVVATFITVCIAINKVMPISDNKTMNALVVVGTLLFGALIASFVALLIESPSGYGTAAMGAVATVAVIFGFFVKPLVLNAVPICIMGAALAVATPYLIFQSRKEISEKIKSFGYTGNKAKAIVVGFLTIIYGGITTSLFLL